MPDVNSWQEGVERGSAEMDRFSGERRAARDEIYRVRNRRVYDASILHSQPRIRAVDRVPAQQPSGDLPGRTPPYPRARGARAISDRWAFDLSTAAIRQ